MIRRDKTAAKTVSYDHLGNISCALNRTTGVNLKESILGSVIDILFKKNYSFKK